MSENWLPWITEDNTEFKVMDPTPDELRKRGILLVGMSETTIPVRGEPGEPDSGVKKAGFDWMEFQTPLGTITVESDGYAGGLDPADVIEAFVEGFPVQEEAEDE